MTLAGSRVAELSVAARLDMAFPEISDPIYDGNTGFVTACPLLGRYLWGIAFTKRRAGENPRLAVARPTGDWEIRERASAQEAGSSTVSTTWITPFDWCTLVI